MPTTLVCMFQQLLYQWQSWPSPYSRCIKGSKYNKHINITYYACAPFSPSDDIFHAVIVGCNLRLVLLKKVMKKKLTLTDSGVVSEIPANAGHVTLHLDFLYRGSMELAVALVKAACYLIVLAWVAVKPCGVVHNNIRYIANAQNYRNIVVIPTRTT